MENFEVIQTFQKITENQDKQLLLMEEQYRELSAIRIAVWIFLFLYIFVPIVTFSIWYFYYKDFMGKNFPESRSWIDRLIK